MKSLEAEINRRRTFAIISHPDAGKTTITEKLLLFGGAIQQAGAVKAKKAAKYTTSDWMELEKERGVSVSTSVMCFEYNNHIINLLDTPGHADFSEDTYRTLSAVDSVLMMIDSVKGVESRTRKLMEVCKQRDIPVITFINKLDREGMNPFDLIDNIEKELDIQATPMTWPISMGKTFKGIYNIYKKQYLRFDSTSKSFMPIDVNNINSKNFIDLISENDHRKLTEDLEIIEGAVDKFYLPLYKDGLQTPVYFGSAINNFGVLDLLEAMISIAPAPQPSPAIERTVDPNEKKVTGLIFKIHANMDPKHRDRIAFMRINSGVFTRGMKLFSHRLKREIKISNPLIFMAQDRAITEEAFPGDIIGIHDTGLIKIGDSFTEGELINFTGIPNFSPELFKKVIVKNALKNKQLTKGLTQLLEEGAIQLFKQVIDNQLVLGAVGELQFDVVKFRLQNEYGADCNYLPYNIAFAYWIQATEQEDLDKFIYENKQYVAMDHEINPVYFFRGTWEVDHLKELYPKVNFFKTSECKEKDKI
ncbi:MAG: peptide chain release factor 3 [Candidatus Margulisbacteria bacterium]|nr:peptide chain release factor 3 [Candidatus Margulisiibacteriota bacterium]